MSQIMGILNVTPDSFSDGGDHNEVETAVSHAINMLEQGADWIDIGGESTRPGAQEVDVEQELKRVIPVIEALSCAIPDIKISIDTSKPEVMAAAVNAGAKMINDVCALQAEGAIQLASERQVEVCLMHMQGRPRTMQQQPQYDNVFVQVNEFLQQRAEDCVAAGISADKIIIDPGFGFGKTVEHNLVLLDTLDQLKQAGFRVLAGLSRKSFLGVVTGQPVEKRLAGSLACAVMACLRGADFIRVHDVEQTRDALLVTQAIISHCGELNAT